METNTTHIAPPVGLPYAAAGTATDPDTGKAVATATCPVCGHVSTGATAKAAAAAFARHFADADRNN